MSDRVVVPAEGIIFLPPGAPPPPCPPPDPEDR